VQKTHVSSALRALFFLCHDSTRAPAAQPFTALRHGIRMNEEFMRKRGERRIKSAKISGAGRPFHIEKIAGLFDALNPC
jgi:hypothetical protein